MKFNSRISRHTSEICGQFTLTRTFTFSLNYLHTRKLLQPKTRRLVTRIHRQNPMLCMRPYHPRRSTWIYILNETLYNMRVWVSSISKHRFRYRRCGNDDWAQHILDSPKWGAPRSAKRFIFKCLWEWTVAGKQLAYTRRLTVPPHDDDIFCIHSTFAQNPPTTLVSVMLAIARRLCK